MPRVIGSISHNKHFEHIKSTGIKFVGKRLICIGCFNLFSTSKVNQKVFLGIKASKKVGNATLRNKFKRRVRASILLLSRSDEVFNHDDVLSITLIARKSAMKEEFGSVHQELKNAIIYTIKRLKKADAQQKNT